MYLVHLYLSTPPGAGDLPPGVEAALSEVQPEVEMAVRHVRANGEPVLGVYLKAPDLHTAEHRAAVAWHLAARRTAGADAWTLLKAEVPLLVLDEPV
ncbi:hypothetical protein [Streptomyces sp. NBC_00347]|uniref:hypothetical protein n=1 Tax=Streptomyces sp. NBC_00347 TaxID=2975721 RepID=UPI00224F1E01|nr:hypothetical protein [Streptomyces sp. NBC_00347]MCX5124568.1 hypothetical protein [Streptomyces sp. NBC_00347]